MENIEVWKHMIEMVMEIRYGYSYETYIVVGKGVDKESTLTLIVPSSVVL